MKIDRHANLLPVENNQTVCTECSIRRLALFHGVPENELDWTQTYRTNQFTVKSRKEIYRESQFNDYMFTVYHGWFAVYKTLDNGKRQILRIALPGDMLGFQADMNAVMTHSAMSLSDAVVCAFPRKDIPDLLRKNLNVAKRLTELNARDMNICQGRLLTIGQQSAIERIAFFCTEIFFRVKSIYNNKDDYHINFPISQEDIGDATGLTKIHVNRTLRTLREEGLMEISGKTLKIHDIDALCKLSNFNPASIQVHPLY
jgi:CRP/FNR family transcriptional regulator, anaerobic regulatory protein